MKQYYVLRHIIYPHRFEAHFFFVHLFVSYQISLTVSACRLALMASASFCRTEAVAWLSWPEHREAFCLPSPFQFQPISWQP